MDAYKILTDKLIEHNDGSFVIDLISQPSEDQMQTLKEGSGHPDSEMRQVNSSAGLAVNFWRAYELCHPGSTVEFEWKKQIPLRRGIPANIDVVIRENDEITFIESKFLEPYYSENEEPRSSYLDISKYSKITSPSQPWVELFSIAKTFKVYNVVQLCRHLLAIYKDMRKKPKEYTNKKVKLHSVTWEIPDSFLSSFPNEVRTEFEKRTEIIRKESKECKLLLNEFISDKLMISSIYFDAVKYNDLIGLIDMSPYDTRLKNQYFL